jgi:hypothetical protein
MELLVRLVLQQLEPLLVQGLVQELAQVQVQGLVPLLQVQVLMQLLLQKLGNSS